MYTSTLQSYDVIVRNNLITNNNIGIYGRSHNYPSTMVVSGNTLKYNIIGIYFTGHDNDQWRIENNTITNCHHGIDIYNTDVTIANNTIVHGAGYSLLIGKEKYEWEGVEDLLDKSTLGVHFYGMYLNMGHML